MTCGLHINNHHQSVFIRVFPNLDRPSSPITGNIKKKHVPMNRVPGLSDCFHLKIIIIIETWAKHARNKITTKTTNHNDEEKRQAMKSHEGMDNNPLIQYTSFPVHICFWLWFLGDRIKKIRRTKRCEDYCISILTFSVLYKYCISTSHPQSKTNQQQKPSFGDQFWIERSEPRKASSSLLSRYLNKERAKQTRKRVKRWQ